MVQPIQVGSRHRMAALAVMLILAVSAAARAAATLDDDDWPEDPEMDLMARTAAVNEGELEFISADAASGAHAHLNHIRITTESLSEGWVTLEQCHENIDAVPAAQILFRDGGVRNLAIASTRNIGRAWVEDHSVQLEDIGRDAKLCISGESRAMYRMEEGLYRLRNGPYMRRFLDGYYPMRVELDIDYPSELIRLVGQSPASQPGFTVAEHEHSLRIDATFEGKLVTCFDFCDRNVRDCGVMAPECSTE